MGRVPLSASIRKVERLIPFFGQPGQEKLEPSTRLCEGHRLPHRIPFVRPVVANSVHGVCALAHIG